MIHIPHAANLFAPDGSLVDTADEERWECVARIYPIDRWTSLSLVLSHPIADLAADCQSLRCAELGAAGVVGNCNETTPRQCGSNGPITTFSVRAGSEKCTLTSARGHHQSSLNTPTSLCQPYDCICHGVKLSLKHRRPDPLSVHVVRPRLRFAPLLGDHNIGSPQGCNEKLMPNLQQAVRWMHNDSKALLHYSTVRTLSGYCLVVPTSSRRP
jgi:hypothetical protein